MISLNSILIALSLLVSAQAFVPGQTTLASHTSSLSVTTTTTTTIPQEWKDKAAVVSAALVTANIPVWAAMAVEDDYEYGAVDAPPLVPIVGGLLAILTALLPIALKPGEEAFEEVCPVILFDILEDFQRYFSLSTCSKAVIAL